MDQSTYTDFNSDEALIDEKLKIQELCEKRVGFAEQLEKAVEIINKNKNKDVLLVTNREWMAIDVEIRNNVQYWMEVGLI